MQSFDILQMAASGGIKSGTKFPNKVDIGQFFYREDLMILFVGMFDSRLRDGNEVSDDSGGPGYIYGYDHNGREVWSAIESFRTNSLNVYVSENGVSSWDNPEAGFSPDLPVNSMLEVPRLVPRRIRGQVTIRVDGKVDSAQFNEVFSIGLTCEDYSFLGTAQLRIKTLNPFRQGEPFEVAAIEEGQITLARPLDWSPYLSPDPQDNYIYGYFDTPTSTGQNNFILTPVGDSKTVFEVTPSNIGEVYGDIGISCSNRSVLNTIIAISNTKNFEISETVLLNDIIFQNCGEVQLQYKAIVADIIARSVNILPISEIAFKSLRAIDCSDIQIQDSEMRDGSIILNNSTARIGGATDMVGTITLNRSDLQLQDAWTLSKGTDELNPNGITVNRWSSVEYTPIGSEAITDPIHIDGSFEEAYVVDTTTSNGILIMPSVGT